MQLFYTQYIQNDKALLAEDDARHVKVLRKNIGDIIQLIDGTGYLYQAQIISFADSKKSNEIQLQILSKELQVKNRTYSLHLYIAPTKQNERMEWMLEKAIEVGLDRITFIQTEHSEKSKINLNRLEKISISAMKQSGEFYKPVIHDVTSFANVIDVEKSEHRLIAHCNNQYEKRSLANIFKISLTQGNITILIGPEGDFSQKEIEASYQNGFKGLSLGSTRLRTETAGLYACMAISALGN